MKTLIAGILVFIFLAGCRKKTDNCHDTIADIAGQYKLTKLEQVVPSTGMAQDITAALSSCQLSGTYTLMADNTINFAEPANCTESGNGRWSVEYGNFISMFSSGGGRLAGLLTSIVTWDCKTLVLITHYPDASTNDRFTLTRL